MGRQALEKPAHVAAQIYVIAEKLTGIAHGIERTVENLTPFPENTPDYVREDIHAIDGMAMALKHLGGDAESLGSAVEAMRFVALNPEERRLPELWQKRASLIAEARTIMADEVAFETKVAETDAVEVEMLTSAGRSIDDAVDLLLVALSRDGGRNVADRANARDIGWLLANREPADDFASQCIIAALGILQSLNGRD